MITQFKIFESERQFREVDLQLLWDDITHNYRTKLFDKPMHLDNYFLNVLKKLLLNKEIEFKRAEHPFDGEVIYGLSGKVISVDFFDDSFNYIIKHISVILNVPNAHAEYSKCALGDISNNFNFNRRPLIIKIYDSEELEIEKKIEFLRDANKYNL